MGTVEITRGGVMGTQPGPAGTPSPTATLRLAIDFIEANAQRDVRAADIADAASVSVRAVQLAFRRHLDTTPMTYLRRVRLAQAHEQLAAGDRQCGATVSEIATRWGFFNAGRFSALYRDIYDELPKQTLRQHEDTDEHCG
jgi:transcriptional regulator GlxA family with amidase domain